MSKLARQTIADFGAQWTTYTENQGYYGSLELLRDLLEPLLPLESLKGARVADIGSGTGRIVSMLLEAGAGHVVAVEPSDAFPVLQAHTAGAAGRIIYQHTTGDAFEAENLDLVVCIGVIHHIPEPAPVLRRIYTALRSGGKVFVWLYGREGNETYLAVAEPLRAITRHLPDRLLKSFCHGINGLLPAYSWLARRLPFLPLARYCREVLAKLSPEQRLLVTFDQLNPAYAKYYRREEAETLLHNAGFINVALHHRHQYSWSVMGVKPEMPEER